jgi:sulfur carrier protein
MIKINGEQMDDVEGMSIAKALKAKGFPEQWIVVECNEEIIPAKQWHQRILADGDCLEIVRFVGGGSNYFKRKDVSYNE